MDELQQHREIIKERLTGQNLSIVELRREARLRHESLLDPSYAADRESLISEIEVLDDMIADALPPPVGPVELLEQLRESNPAAASALQHTMDKKALEQNVIEAREFVEQQPNSDRGRDRLAAAELKLAELGLPGFAQNLVDARSLREEGEKLERAMIRAADQDEADQLQSEAYGKYEEARALESNRQVAAPSQADNDTDAGNSDDAAISAAEAAVASAMQVAE